MSLDMNALRVLFVCVCVCARTHAGGRGWDMGEIESNQTLYVEIFANSTQKSSNCKQHYSGLIKTEQFKPKSTDSSHQKFLSCPRISNKSY